MREPYIIHAIPGRMRIHMPGWSEQQQHGIERRLCLIPGVSSVQANPLTGNVLIRFDSAVTTATILFAATLNVPSRHVTMREQDTPAQAQPRNVFQMSVTHATACKGAPQSPITRPTHASPARKPVGDTGLSPTALPMLVQPVARFDPSRARTAGAVIPRWAPEREIAQEVARSQVVRNLDTLLEVSYRRNAPAISRHVVRQSNGQARTPTSASGPSLPETSTVHARRSSILIRILRMLLVPGVAAFVLNATSVILSLARAGSPLGFVFGGIEVLQLLAETHQRWFAFTPVPSYRIDRVCMQCQAAF